MDLFSVRYDHVANNVEISFSYEVTPASIREFKFNRKTEEPLSKTFDKIRQSITAQVLAKRKKKDLLDNFTLTIALYEDNDKQVVEETINLVAWKENFKLALNDKVYRVSVDLPYFKKITLPKILIAGMPAVIAVEMPDNHLNYSKFLWYTKLKDRGDWELVGEGVNKRMLVLDPNSEEKKLKVIGIPSDGKREGLPIEVISTNEFRKRLDIDKLPMTERHNITRTKLSGNA